MAKHRKVSAMNTHLKKGRKGKVRHHKGRGKSSIKA
jgi:hypothetical protein